MSMPQLKKSQPVVVISSGNHSIVAPRNADRVISALFREAGFNTGTIEVRVASKIKCSSLSPVYTVSVYPQTNTIELKVKAGDNNSRFQYYYKPSGMKESLDEIYLRLKNAADTLQSGKGKLEKKTPGDEKRPEELRLTLVQSPQMPEPVKAKKGRRHASDVLSDETIRLVFFDEIRSKVVNGLIKRATVMQVIRDQKFDCDEKYILKHLLSLKFFEVTDDTKDEHLKTYRFIDPMVTSAPADMKSKDNGNRGLVRAASMDTILFSPNELEAFSKMKAAAKKFQQASKELAELKDRIEAAKKDLVQLERLYSEKVCEMEPLKASAQQLDQIRAIMSSAVQ